jgi:hypothetical protein
MNLPTTRPRRNPALRAVLDRGVAGSPGALVTYAADLEREVASAVDAAQAVASGWVGASGWSG